MGERVGVEAAERPVSKAAWLLLVPLVGLLAACGGAPKYDQQVNVCLAAHTTTEVVIKEMRDSTEHGPDPAITALFRRACKAAGAK